MVAYVPTWAEGIQLETTPLKGVTNLVYAFLEIRDGQCARLHDDSGKLLEQFRSLKQRGVHKTLGLGGESNSKGFSEATATPEAREHLVETCLKFARENDFQGVDIDWEFPSKEEQPQFVALLKEFRSQMHEREELSIAGRSDDEIADQDISGIAKQVDWISVMTYDQCDTKSKTTCHHARFDGADDSGRKAIETYLAGGARAEQLLYGIPFYGYKWKISTFDNNGIGRRVKPHTRPQEIPYAKIKEKFLCDADYQQVYDDDAQEPVLVSEANGEVISYENERSIAYKLNATKNLGGVMIWDLSQDDADHTLLFSVTKYLGK